MSFRMPSKSSFLRVFSSSESNSRTLCACKWTLQPPTLRTAVTCQIRCQNGTEMEKFELPSSLRGRRPLRVENSDVARSDSMSAVDPEAPLSVDIIAALADCKYKPTCAGTAVTCLLSRLIAAFWRSASAFRLALPHIGPSRKQYADGAAIYSLYI